MICVTAAGKIKKLPSLTYAPGILLEQWLWRAILLRRGFAEQSSFAEASEDK
jgi:hypothetical protein